MDRKVKGKYGEQVAQYYYKQNGFEILEANFRHRRAEIDIIAIDKDETLLVFAEVKSRVRSDFGEAETFVSDSQQNRIKEAAEEYIHNVNWKKDIRFDIVCITGNDQIRVFEDAF